MKNPPKKTLKIVMANNDWVYKNLSNNKRHIPFCKGIK